MSNQNEWSLETAQMLVQLAGAAADDLSAGPILPAEGNWSVLGLLSSDHSQRPPLPEAQGFVADGNLTPGGELITVVALGLPWKNFLDGYYSGTPLLQPLPGIFGSGAEEQVDSFYSPIYQDLRISLWKALAQAQGTKIYVTGKGLAGGLALLGTLDLRPGNDGPSGENAPVTSSPCYVFSTPAIGNRAFASYFNKTAPETYSVWMGTASLPVDFFPLKESSSTQSVPVGIQKSIKANLPTYDVPWTERSDEFYLNGLGGMAFPPPTQPASIPNPPAGFDQSLAFTLAKLAAVSYQQRQHPTALIPDISPFSIAENLTSGGTQICTVLTSHSSVVVAFRGTVTAEEFFAWQAYSQNANPKFIDNNRLYVSQGLLGVYTAGSEGKTFREVLIDKIFNIASGRDIYLVGHSFGGGLAALAAVDFASNKSQITPKAVYTYGAGPFGNMAFGSLYRNLKLSEKSYFVYRPGDFLPRTNFLLGNFFPLNPQVELQGTPENDDVTQHDLSGYIELLDTRN